MFDKLMPSAAIAVAVYLVVISIVAVIITVRDKNIAIANGRLEDEGTKDRKKAGRAQKGKNAKDSTKSGSGQKGKNAKSAKDSGEKKNAKKNSPQPQRRVPENTLLAIAALGGSVAMLITMRTIRHKTQHAKFMLGIPVIIVLQCALVVALVVLL